MISTNNKKAIDDSYVLHSFSKKAIIIGAGIAGIGSAIRLAVRGYAVEVLEANSFAGGKLSEFVLPEGTFSPTIPSSPLPSSPTLSPLYRFDAGPSLFTMPEYVEELFRLAGKNPQEHFEYIQLDTVCKYFYEDGTILHAYSDNQRFAEEVAQKTTEKASTVLKFLRESKRKYDLTAEVFLHNSLHKWQNYLTWATLRGIIGMPRLQVFTTMHEANARTFQDKRMVQFFNRYATYNGSNPYETPATLNIIPHLEFGIGAFFPKGGMYQITQSLVKLAESLGVTFHYNTKAEEILVEAGKVVGVRVEGLKGARVERADIVVSNMDIVGTYKRLLPALPAPKRLLEQPKSSSAVIFYWGVKCAFPELELHNIFFSQDYEAEFKHLFQDKDLFDDNTIYVNISSKEAPNDAPEGCENWFVMINAPNNVGQDWDRLIAQARENILKKLSRLLKVDMGSLIVCEAILDPRSIESRTSSSQGALYGNSSNNKWAAFLRHANFSSKVKGLYFCGGSVHPGGGIPLSLLSAKIACDCVKS
jgi:phytoene desaturase